MNEYSYEIDKYIVGVDSNGEDGIGLTIATMKDNKLYILGSCYGDNARFIDLLIKENEELKKQLEELEKSSANAINKQVARGVDLVNQQQEFVKYLEDEIEMMKAKWGNKLTENGYLDIAMTVRAYQIILQKYEEIIGGNKDE